jgi:hypothetical protein
MKKYTVEVDGKGTKSWYLNGLLHREDGPAIEYANGTKFWYLNDEPHREDGPAIEYADGTKYWYLNGDRHRIDGPAIEYADGTKYWYLNDKELPEEEFNARTKTKELTINEIESLLGYKIKVVRND